jgi:hypothetical protein
VEIPESDTNTGNEDNAVADALNEKGYYKVTVLRYK